MLYYVMLLYNIIPSILECLLGNIIHQTTISYTSPRGPFAKRWQASRADWIASAGHLAWQALNKKRWPVAWLRFFLFIKRSFWWRKESHLLLVTSFKGSRFEMCRSETVRSIQIRLCTSLGIVDIVLEWKSGWIALRPYTTSTPRKHTLFAEPASR